ncbi:MAG: hypothetical protein ABR878_07480 [Roseiarcus sp.]
MKSKIDAGSAAQAMPGVSPVEGKLRFADDLFAPKGEPRVEAPRIGEAGAAAAGGITACHRNCVIVDSYARRPTVV